jgi:ABC-type antimicrobial peptide transport system permease subunit
MFGTFTDIVIAAPLGFLVGLFCGVLAANRFIIITPREKYRVVKRDDEPDHHHKDS